MAEAASGEIRLLREQFNRHEDRDLADFDEVKKDIGDLQVKFANLMGRMTVVGGLAIFLIPILTAYLQSLLTPHLIKP